MAELKRRVREMFSSGSPALQDVAHIERDGEVISVSLGGEVIQLNSADPHLSLRIAYLKSRIVRITQDLRASAMLKAAGVATDIIPPWLISTRIPIVEWITWAGCLDDIVKRIQTLRRLDPSPLVSGRVSLDVQVGGRDMTFRGGIYRGVLSATINLCTNPTFRYFDEPQSRFIVDAVTLPETVIGALNAPQERSNRGLRLCDIVEHPFLSAYDAPVMSVLNRNRAVEILLDTSYSTLAPVPAAALRAMPRDADPVRAFDLTRSERETLRALTGGGVATIC